MVIINFIQFKKKKKKKKSGITLMIVAIRWQYNIMKQVNFVLKNLCITYIAHTVSVCENSY